MENSSASSNVALTNPRPEGRGNRRNGAKCCTKFVSILCSNLGVCILVLVYTLLGAILFSSLESKGMSHHRILPVKHLSSADTGSLNPSDPPASQSDDSGGAASGGGGGGGGGEGQPVAGLHQKTDANAAPAAVISGGELDPEQLRHQTVERLWSITESLNILYRENWTRVVEKELWRYSQELLSTRIRPHHLETEDEAAASRKRQNEENLQPYKEQWTFAGSFLYSLTVITTIGYGSVAPQTAIGRIASIVYAILGIPLMLLYLSSVGDMLSRCLKWIWCRMCRCKRKQPRTKLAAPSPSLTLSSPYANVEGFQSSGCPPDCRNPEHVPIPVTFCLVIMTIYICGGAALFARAHNWSYLHALYFCFGALTTIGFGDLTPTTEPQDTADAQLQLIGVSLYLLVGMALIATCFNLMQEQVTSRASNSVITRKLSGLVTSQAPHHRFHLDDT